ncbi:MAG: hypothetical protein HUU31_14205, partial [Anaerolineae bacterium]|nr:hypothetical protein [Anaerolineae bacterium]
MLTRTYRAADKLGVVALKSSLALVDLTLDGIGVIWHGVAQLLLLLARVLLFILRPVGLLIGAVAGLFLGGARRAAVGAARTGSA